MSKDVIFEGTNYDEEEEKTLTEQLEQQQSQVRFQITKRNSALEPVDSH